MDCVKKITIFIRKYYQKFNFTNFNKRTLIPNHENRSLNQKIHPWHFFQHRAFTLKNKFQKPYWLIGMLNPSISSFIIQRIKTCWFPNYLFIVETFNLKDDWLVFSDINCKLIYIQCQYWAIDSHLYFFHIVNENAISWIAK